jgi:Ca2+-binding EF-hand superfamily protein
MAGPARDFPVSRRDKAREQFSISEVEARLYFTQFDVDQSGYLDRDEVRMLLQEFLEETHDITPEELVWVFKIADQNGDDRISLQEMVHAIRAWHGYVHISEEYADLFDAYSMDGEGLTLEELRSLLTALNDGAEVSEADAADVLEHADVLGDGVIQRFELLGAIGTWYVSIGRDPPGATKSAVDGLRYASQRTLLQTLLVLFPCASGLCAGPQRLVSSCGGLGKGVLALVVKAAQVAFAVYALVQAYPFLGAESTTLWTSHEKCTKIRSWNSFSLIIS